MTQIARKEREELNGLSKDVFGTSSRWQKLVNQGYVELLSREVQETIPAEKEGEAAVVRKVSVPVLSQTGAKQYVTKHHTVESVREFLVAQKAQLDSLRQQFKEQQESALAKEKAEAQAKELHRTLSGSAT